MSRRVSQDQARRSAQVRHDLAEEGREVDIITIGRARAERGGDAPSFTDWKGSLEHDPDMATTRMEVRQLTGKLLPEFCFDDLPDSRLPVDQFSAIARRELQMIRDEGGQLTAFSVHFFRGSDEIGSWSLDRERAVTDGVNRAGRA
jgi:hypothetical protein